MMEKSVATKMAEGTRGKGLSNQTENCSSEQGFLDEGNGDGGQK